MDCRIAEMQNLRFHAMLKGHSRLPKYKVRAFELHTPQR